MIRTLRQRAVLSQTEVAEKIGVSLATVSRWEAGTRVPRPEHIRALAKLYGVKPVIIWQAIEAESGKSEAIAQAI